MNDERQIEPWPTWGRYPLIAVLVVVAVVGILTFIQSGLSGAVVRIVLAAVLVPALLVPLQLWGRRCRSRRLGLQREDGKLRGRSEER